MTNSTNKIEWQGTIVSIQPRTRIWRYLTDNRTHYHLGYNLFLDGEADYDEREFVVAISEKQQQSGGFRIGDIVSGTAWMKEYPEREYADFYRAGALKVIRRAPDAPPTAAPPWLIEPPDLAEYEERGARMLSLSCWKGKCFQCAWAAMANAEIAWDIDKRVNKHRFESFCYGPKSCRLYKMGKARAVPYKGSGSSLDSGWLDELITEGRDWDE
ncbi:hypothetical protein FACS1894208_02470 [Clostridia bacterium]|nr:hypothetical protein FACS1894208_02470 [Clostridia bacterium]